MFAESYSKNSRERAKGESCALLKISVLSRRQNEETNSWSSQITEHFSWKTTGFRFCLTDTFSWDYFELGWVLQPKENLPGLLQEQHFSSRRLEFFLRFSTLIAVYPRNGMR